MDYELEYELDKIKKFSPLNATYYYDEKGNVTCYFGILIQNGKIDTEKYPNGRRRISDSNEKFLCFKKVLDSNDNVTLYLRNKLDISTLSKIDLILYKYIKNNCKFESY